MAKEVVWLMVVALGPLLLGALIAYALIRRQRHGPPAREARTGATGRLYEEEPHHRVASSGR